MSLVLNDLAVVLDELHDVRKMWYEIGLRLLLPVEDLETISSEHKNDQHSLRRVILLWLKSGGATWAKLCDALSNRTVGEMTQADKLRERYCNKEVKENGTAEKIQSTQEISKTKAEPEPECSRKSSQDYSVDKYSTVDSTDGDVAIIDVGSPSCEQYRAADKTPSAETKKRGLDSPVVQSESKKARGLLVPESFSQDDFSKLQPADRQCVRCERIPHSPVRSDCCKTLYCKSCAKRSKMCQQHEEEVEFFPDSSLRIKIQRLRVKCLNRERGCEWKGRVRHLKDHLPECADSLPSEISAFSDTEDKMAEDSNLSSMVNEDLPSPRVSTSDCINHVLVSKKVERKTNEALDITVAAVMGGVEMGSEFNNDSIEGGGERSEMCNADTNCLTPPLNLVMTPVSKYQASKDESWLSLSFLSHQLGYKLCLTAKILPNSGTKLNDSVQLELGIVSAQGQQDSFLKFPCIGDAKVKLLNPHRNEGHKEISMGFMIHNEQHKSHAHELSYPMIVPKEFIFKDRLFFHVVAVQLSEDHRPWLLDPSQVAEDTACSSDSESECNVVC